VIDPGGSAVLLVTVVNDGSRPDRLLALSSPIAARSSVLGDVDLPAGAELTAAAPSPAPGNLGTQLQLMDLRQPLRPGVSYPVELDFASAGRLILQVALADPDSPRPDCPLPVGGRPDRVFAAPLDEAPLPEPAPAPSCSTLLHE
jgi:hypothetical protein